MAEERNTKKNPHNHNHEADDQRAEQLFASFFREEIASVENPPPLPAYGTSRSTAYETSHVTNQPHKATEAIPSPESTKKPAPALLPDLLFAASVLLLLTITIVNPKYSIQSPLVEAGISFARERQIGFYLEKGLAAFHTAFHEAADPVFRNPVFRKEGEKK